MFPNMLVLRKNVVATLLLEGISNNEIQILDLDGGKRVSWDKGTG